MLSLVQVLQSCRDRSLLYAQEDDAGPHQELLPLNVQ